MILLGNWHPTNVTFCRYVESNEARPAIRGRVWGAWSKGGSCPPFHPTDQSGSSLRLRAGEAWLWRALCVDRGGFPVAILSRLGSGYGGAGNVPFLS